MALRIDTHQHFAPADYREWVAVHGMDAGGMPVPEWDVERALGTMDDLDITSAVVSVSTPGVHLSGYDIGASGTARRWARKLNETAADLARKHPGRFGFFATLTLPDVDGAIDEAVYALDELGADGVILPTNVYGRYVGQAPFAPLFEELGRRKCVIFLHPSELPASPTPGIPPFAVDFLLDTVRAALSLVRSGTLETYPEMPIILAHAGGFLPYAALRMAPFAADGDPARGISLLQQFYFDVALSASPFALPSLLAFAKPERITFGSDFPFPPPPVVKALVQSFDDFDFSDSQRAAICFENAERLFPRFAKSVEPALRTPEIRESYERN